MQEGSKKAKKPLVIVVHGVGEIEEGETVEALSSAISSSTSSPKSVNSEIVWLHEQNMEGQKMSLYPAHVKRINVNGTNMVFAETYWADLSRPAKGILGTIKEVFNVIFGLEFIVQEAANQTTNFSSLYQILSKFILAALRGPIAALNAMLALGGLVFVWYYFFFDCHANDTTGGIMMLSLGFVVAAVSYFGLRKIHNRWRTFLIWMVFSGLFLSFVATFSLTVKDTQWFYNYEMWLSSKIDQLTAGQKKKSSDSDSDSDCSTSECKAVKRFTSLERYGVNLLNALNVAWLFLAIGMVTLLLIWGKKYLLSDKTKKPSLMIAYSSIGIMIWLWMLAMSTFWGVVRNNLPPGIIRVSLVEAGLPLMGLNWLIILVLGIGFFIVWLCRLHWCKNNSTKMYDLKNTPLRLLVAPFVQAILLGISILAAIFIIRLWIGALMGNMPNQDMVLLNKGTKIAISILGIISFVGTFLMTSLQAGLDICQDVISYFRFTSANDTTEGNNKNYKTRQRILNRVRTVLKILVDQENPDKVTVVAHSQGTVFAIEVLQEDWITTLGDKKINWNFITMGSPFTHLYQHYFPESFPFPIKLRKFMSCWLNIFRIDDFVGTHINGEKGWPENIPVDQGGHTGYWADKNVVEILRRTIL